MALSLNLSHISYSYPHSPEPAIHDLSAAFDAGWTGIVGANGCGKTTLARIACGLIDPDEGTVSPSLSFALCAQETATEPDGLFDFACDYAAYARRLRAILRIDDDMPWRFDELSCGERKKIQVATALWMQPELLVLDEPTNHVDAACRGELQKALAEYRGIGILISHDRPLLDALVSRCLCFEDGKALIRRGTYADARKQGEIERCSSKKAREQAKSKLAATLAEQERRKHHAARTASRLSARNLNEHDADGRARRNLAKVSGQDGKAGLLAARIGERALKARAALDAAYVAKRYEGSLRFNASPCPRKTLVRLEACRIPCGNGSLVVPETFIGPSERIGIQGANGTGKSTLVRHLMATLSHMPSDAPETLFVPQELDDRQKRAAVEAVERMGSAERGHILSIVAQLDSDPMRILSGALASPGEARKLLIACGIAREPALIVMDEPTNHLDIHAVEALEKALADFDGALVLVSHDGMFLRTTCESIITLEKRDGETVCTPSRR